MMAGKQVVRDVMTPDPIVLDASASVRDAARAMRTRDVGDVLVRSAGKLCGIVTDRDIVVRAIAEDAGDPASTPIGDICTEDVECLGPDDDADDAVRLMRDRAIRRVPVVENGQPVGIVSIGDLAVRRDRESALGEISAAPPTR
jgi:CBS domain-containing protein